jgi:hypothetical protein
VLVKGKSEPLLVYEVLGRKEANLAIETVPPAPVRRARKIPLRRRPVA